MLPPRRFVYNFTRRERAALVQQCARRTGSDPSDLQQATFAELQRLLDESRHEQLIDEEAASALLDPEEIQRVRNFLAGDEAARSLLDGLLPADIFIKCFLVWSGEQNQGLLSNGRSLLQVVQRIRELGGLKMAAELFPWLGSAVHLAANFSFDHMMRRRIFVRYAMHAEALSVMSTCASGNRAMYIEEGQHRAIAATWNLTNGGRTAPTSRLIAYIRGVNRRGAAGGAAFWRVNGIGIVEGYSDRYPTAELCSGAVCVLLLWATATRSRGCMWRRHRGQRARRGDCRVECELATDCRHR